MDYVPAFAPSGVCLVRHPVTTVWVSQVCLQEMEAEAERMAPLETGGVLMGYCEGEAVVITRVVGPGLGAVHERAQFVPDAGYHEGEVARIYHESGRRHTYLGDWHTHPASPAYMSRLDRQTLARIARHREARQARPIMAVLGGGDPWRMSVWRWESGYRWARRFRSSERACELCLY